MKKTRAGSFRAAALFAAIVLALSCALCSCEWIDHDEELYELSENNGEYREKRLDFLDSDAYKEAYAYVEATLAELFPGGEVLISIEPGDLLGADLSQYAGLSDDLGARMMFFSEARLSFEVNFWDFGADGSDVAEEMLSRGISGKMTGDKYHEIFYKLDALKGRVEVEIVPVA